jgi:hypothetical protein
MIEQRVLDSLPDETALAVADGEATVIVKFGTCIIVDNEDAEWVDILPLTNTQYGWSLCIHRQTSKPYYVSLCELLLKIRGKSSFNNKCRQDYRKCNIVVTPWDA